MLLGVFHNKQGSSGGLFGSFLDKLQKAVVISESIIHAKGLQSE